MTVSIIGLGLIGGSLAKVIKSRTNHRVLGFDKSKTTLSAAYEGGAIDDICTNFSDTDIAFIALYPAAAVEFIKSNAKSFKKGCVIIDLCGVKRFVCESLSGTLPKGVTFIGGHPMAGRECSGFENSTADMFSDASMILTPDEDIPLGELERVCDFINELGFGHIEVTDPKRHDEMIAYTSQLAHIVSSAYVKSPLAKKFIGFSAGSFNDMTRVAKLNEVMWAELFLHNRDFLQHHIEVLIGNLKEFSDTLSSGDEMALRELLREGREIKEALEAELFTV